MNLEEIAQLGGVSRSTVSRVLNEDRRVSPNVRERVLEIMRVHDYHPHAAARSLASRRTHILGLLIPQTMNVVFSDPFFPLMIQGMIEACNARKQNLMMLMESSSDPEAEAQLHRRVIQGRSLDGLIIASNILDLPLLNRLQTSQFPFVLIGHYPGDRTISFVDVDNQGAAHQAVSHLIAHGYHRIAMITGMPNMIASMDRYQGYQTALLAAGRQPDPQLVAQGYFTRPGGYQAMQTLLPQRPDAVFVASDTMALGAVQALQEVGLHVPDDVALFGFDDINQGVPPQSFLSTVRQPIAELGRQAVQLLLEQIEQADHGPQHRFLETKLMYRRSCGCPMPADGAGQGGDDGLPLPTPQG